jgi:CRP/FNR family transcriptional regulator, cyclic AMP receptor protein
MPKSSEERALSTTVQVDTIFQEIALFADLNSRSRRRLLAQCVPKSYPAGALVLEEGDTALGLFLIGSGEVEVFKTEDGQRVPLARLRAGDLLGEMALFDEAPRSASAEALKPTECLLLTRGGFHAALQEEPEILSRIVPRLVQRLRSTQDRLVELEAREEDEAEGIPPGAAPQRSAPSARKRSASDTATAFVQAQHALLVGGATGVAASARVFAGFLRAVAEEAELAAPEDLPTLARRLPQSLLAAGRRVLAEAERVPEQTLDRTLLELRRNRGRKG